MYALAARPRYEQAPDRLDPPPAVPRRRGASAWIGPALALLIYGALAPALFPNVAAHLTSAFPGDLGDPPSQAWILAWDVHALGSNPAHLFDANIFYPFHDVLAYQDSLLGLLPFAAPVLLLTGNAILAYNLLFLLTFALCAWGAFLLARLLVGDARAAFLAGLVYGYSPYRMAHLYHLNLLCGMWVPFALLCWERVRRGDGRYWTGVGLFFVLQALSALYYAAFLAVALAVLIGLHWREARRGGAVAGSRSLIPGAALTALCGAAVLFPFIVPYLRVERGLGATRGLGQAVYFAADARDFLHSVDLSMLYGWTGHALGIGPNIALQYLWPGATALSLALWGLAAARRRHGGWSIPHTAYAILGLAAAVLCLGPFLKLWGRQTGVPLPYLLLYRLPGFAGLRDPARFGVIYTLCLALLAAYGAAALFKLLSGKATLLAAALCAVVLAESWIRPLPATALPSGAAAPAVYRWLAARPAGSAVLELPIGLDNKAVWAEQAEMMYYSTLHWQPIVNGTGGFAPPGYAHDAAIYNSFPSPGALRLLRERRVRYVVVHRAWAGERAADAIHALAVRHGVKPMAHWADADVYAVP